MAFGRPTLLSDNASLAQLKRTFAELPRRARTGAQATLIEEAQKLAAAMKQAVPVKSGKLRDSIRVEAGRNALEVKVKAGGPLTTKEVRAGSGVSYDYALGTEFGTQKEAAEPFFFTTYRAKRRGIRRSIANSLGETVSK
jgi:HK97 gp10 family phage protein